MYVPTDEDEDPTDDPANAERRQETARLRRELGAAAVQIVQQDSEWVGWTLNKPKSETNEGYDLEAVRGDEIRYIEVKGVVDVWDDIEGVAVSEPQYQFAARNRAKFWLYVVEHVKDGLTPVIHRIEDPVSKITQFCFTGSWRKLAEAISPTPQTPTSVAHGAPVQPEARIRVDNVGEGKVIAVVRRGLIWSLKVEFADGSTREMPWNTSRMTILGQDVEGESNGSNAP